MQFAIERGLRRLLDLRMHAITYQVAALGPGRSVTAKDPELAQRSGRSAGSRGHPYAKGLGRAIVADLPGSGSIGLRKISWWSARTRRSAGGGALASQAGSPEPTAQYWIPQSMLASKQPRDQMQRSRYHQVRSRFEGNQTGRRVHRAAEYPVISSCFHRATIKFGAVVDGDRHRCTAFSRHL